jgi:PAS domain S-box-containing protein
MEEIMAADHSTRDSGIDFDLRNYMGGILDVMMDGLVVVNRQRKIIYVNQAMKTISGYSPGELLGSSCSILQFSNCPAVDGRSIASPCEIFFGQDMKRMRCTILHKRGHQVHVLKNAAALRSEKRELVAVVESITDISSIVKQERELNNLRNKIYRPEGFMGMLGASPVMKRVFEMVRSAAITDAPVIIHGDSGTGKELVANMLHRLSKRRKGPLVKVNCAALAESLLESELFGHVKGAFTGASQTRKGRFEMAHGGSIFLDEIGDVPSSIQLKLLRVLETKEFERVGDSRPMKADVRFISATHRNLKELMDIGKIREDFYYRLNVIPIRLPALKERGDDLNMLVSHFIRKIAEADGFTVPRINSAAMVMLKSYSWPGNIRELISALKYACVASRGRTIEPHHLPMSILANAKTSPTRRLKPIEVLGQKDRILGALESTGGNKAAAARMLGVSRVTLWKWLKNIEASTH